MARPPITKANPYTPKGGRFAGRTFHTERDYRNALAQVKGFQSWYDQQQQTRRTPTVSDVQKLRPAERQARRRALTALSKMRTDGLSLKAAAKAAGTTVNAVKRHAGSALERSGRGRYHPSSSDALLRSLRLPTPSGVISIDVRDSGTSSLISDYWHAVRLMLDGNPDALKRFDGVTFTDAHGRQHRFVTDEATLDRLFHAQELTFDDIYYMEDAA